MKKNEYTYSELCNFFGEKEVKNRTNQLEKWRKEYNITKIKDKNIYTLERLSNDKIKHTYSDLCKFFNEDELTTNSQRNRQMEKWRKDYAIEKIPNKNLYTIRELSFEEKAEIQTYCTYQQTIEPMLYYLLAEEKNHCLVKDIPQLLYELNIVNADYQYVRNNMNEASCVLLNKITKDEISSYYYETYKMFKRIIKSVLDSMKTKDDIFYNELYGKITTDKNGFKRKSIMTDREIEELLAVRKTISLNNYGENYDKLEKKYQREVDKLVNKELHIDNYYTVYKIILNKGGITRTILNNDYVFANFINFGKLTNEKIQIKVNNSKQGELKNLIEYDKKLLTDNLINMENSGKLTEKIKKFKNALKIN